VRDAGLPVHAASVLELGCGTGKNSEWLARHARRLIALDLSPGMLARARQRVPAGHATFVRADVRATWPVRDDAFDVVVGNLVLEHVETLAPVFAEAARVLRPGGRLFVCELHPFRQRRGGQAHFTDAGTGETIHVPAHTHSVSDYVNGAVAAGFTVLALGEWVEPDAPADALPRLLSLSLRRA
jgi:ubiquinone/menaquinone biosynthesis C-methylase UbiE